MTATVITQATDRGNGPAHGTLPGEAMAGRATARTESPTPRVAVLVIRRARAMSAALLETLESLVNPRSLYVSHSLGSAQGIARYLVGERYDVIMCAGGDGTFTRTVTDVFDAVGQRWEAMPAFGILRLGTGNGVATTLGASPRNPKGLAMDLWRARATAPAGVLSMIEVEGQLTPFAGFGYDARILHDHERLARTLGR